MDRVSLAEQIATVEQSLRATQQSLKDKQRWVEETEKELLFWTSILTSLNNLDS